jgi:hypothetical protein
MSGAPGRRRLLCMAIGGLAGLACSGSSSRVVPDSAVAPDTSPKVVPMGPEVVDPGDGRYALLVGIEAYPTATDDLVGPATEVAEMRRVLEQRFRIPAANIRTLVNAEATRDAIIDGFATHLTQAGVGGTAIFFYSGHGIRMDLNYSLPDTEATGVDQALYVRDANGRTTIILDDELGVLISRLPAARKLVMLDACFSGTGARVFGNPGAVDDSVPIAYPMEVRINRVAKRMETPANFVSDGAKPPPSDDYVLLAAARDSERAFAMRHWPRRKMARTVFGYFLTTALDTRPDSVPLHDVLAWIRQAADTAMPCRSMGACQRPQVQGRDSTATLARILGNPPRLPVIRIATAGYRPTPAPPNTAAANPGVARPASGAPVTRRRST